MYPVMKVQLAGKCLSEIVQMASLSWFGPSVTAGVCKHISINYRTCQDFPCTSDALPPIDQKDFVRWQENNLI